MCMQDEGAQGRPGHHGVLRAEHERPLSLLGLGCLAVGSGLVGDWARFGLFLVDSLAAAGRGVMSQGTQKYLKTCSAGGRFVFVFSCITGRCG